LTYGLILFFDTKQIYEKANIKPLLFIAFDDLFLHATFPYSQLQGMSVSAKTISANNRSTRTLLDNEYDTIFAWLWANSSVTCAVCEQDA